MDPGPAALERPARRARILVADDDPGLRRALDTLLSAEGFQVETAGDGAAVRAALARRPPDLVLLDHAGRGGGLRLLRGLRAARGTRHLPVILLSVADEHDPRVRGLAAGADDYLVKPFSEAELLARVRTQLELAGRREAAHRRREQARRRADVERERLLAAAEESRAQAEAANRMKDEFLATLSHELRTPLNAIVGWVHLLRAGRLDDVTTSRALQTIDRNARIQTQLISDILDVSRIDCGQFRVHMRPLELAPILQSALDTVRLAAEAKAIRLGLTVDPLAGPLLGDPDRLQQVVWNLLSNAIKFTPDGGRVEVSLRREGEQAVLRVMDDGIGIAPEFLPFVFERSRQADPSTTRHQGGLGLGLAIVRHLVHMHGGTVVGESQGEGRGATFTLRLPLAEPDPAPAAEARPPYRPALPLTGPSLEGVSVLLVDDDEGSRAATETVLRERGADVLFASSAEEALEMVKRLRPDVLLARLVPRGADGHRLIRALREIPPERGGLTPAAALSEVAATQDKLDALLAGYQVHLAQPVAPPELATVVASLAGRTRDCY